MSARLMENLFRYLVRPYVLFGIFILCNGAFFSGVHFVDTGDIAGVFGIIRTLVVRTIGTGLLVILASALGLFFLRRTNTRAFSGMTEGVVAFGLGIATLGLGTFALAVLQQARFVSVIAMLIFVAYLTRRELVLLWDMGWKENSLPTSFLRRGGQWLPMIFILGVLEFCFVSSAATILNAGYDSFHQYLTFPVEYSRQGGLVTFLWHPSWGFPQLGEMIFLLPVILFGIPGPFLINFVFLIALFVAFAQLIKNEQASSMQYWLVACIASSPIILAFGTGYVKIELMYYFFFIAVFIILKKICIYDPTFSFQNRQLGLVLGIFFGALFSMKYTAFFIIAALFLAMFFLSREKGKFLRGSFFVGSIAFLVMSPWLIKNWVVYKSPLYPIFQGQDQLFQETGKMCSQYFGQFATQDLILRHAEFIQQTSSQILNNLSIFLFSVTHVTFSGALFMLPGLWFIFFLPVVVWYVFQWSRLSILSKLIILFSGVFSVFWVLFLFGGMWYLFPFCLVLLSLVAFESQKKTVSGDVEKKFIKVVAFLSIVLALNMFDRSDISASLRYANGDRTLSEVVIFTPNEVGPLALYDRMNSLLSENQTARIYSFMEPRGYFVDDSSKRFVLDYYGEKLHCLGGNEEVIHSFKKLGIKYIYGNMSNKVLCEKMMSPHKNELCQSIERFELLEKNDALQLLERKGDAVLYELR